MKKIIKNIIFVFILLFAFCLNINAKTANVYVFYGKECPHCEDALEYLNSIKKKYDIKIYKYEVWHNSENKEQMEDIGEYLEVDVKGVPFVVIDNTPISGYSSGITDETYKYHIKLAAKEDFVDQVGIKLGVVEDTPIVTTKPILTTTNQSIKVKVPLIGKVDLKKVSLPVASILLGLTDGFNPCAMWILLFLISTLIGMKDKKRLWILGLTFLITSSLVYLLFMVSVLSFVKLLKGVALVRLIIALVALIGGLLNLKSYIKSLNKDAGCDVVDDKKRKKLFTKIKKFTHEKSFFFALLGIMLLAASVNLIELACSAGIPVIFTSLLAMNDLNTSQYVIYFGLYILFFMLDDLIVFIVAIKTFELTGISTKYSKYSHLVGGILMVLIGLLLVFKPEWLMFNF